MALVNRPPSIELIWLGLRAVVLPSAPALPARLRRRARPPGRLASGEGD
jgi:hypothetical protein